MAAYPTWRYFSICAASLSGGKVFHSTAISEFERNASQVTWNNNGPSESPSHYHRVLSHPGVKMGEVFNFFKVAMSLD